MILREQELNLNSSLKKIDKEKWPRAYYYDYFMNSMRCRFGMTANIDITSGTWLMPFVLVGKFFEQDGKTFLPVHIKVHHATCDGYHVGRFYSELQSLVNNAALRLKI